MDIKLSGDSSSLQNLFGISDERIQEMVGQAEVLADLKNVARQKPENFNFQKTLDTLLSICLTPGEEAYMISVYAKIVNNLLAYKEAMKMRNDFYSQFLSQN